MADRIVPHPFVSGSSKGYNVQLPTSFASVERASRRPVSGSGWSLPSGDDPLRQPQDGAVRFRAEPSRVSSIEAYLPGGSLLEPEDAWLTGSTRSLRRRLLGLNMATAALNTTLDTLRNAPFAAAKAASAVMPKPARRTKVA